MKGEASNDVFISYRREVGGVLAMAIHQQLTERGLDAFYDIESLRAGQFDAIILNQIAARPYFLLVLTPGTLDRCRDPGDWVRREIEQALATNRMIVPANTPGFDFDDFERFLPEDIGPVVGRFNALELPQRWFKFAVQQLVDEFLVPIELDNTVPPDEDQVVVDRLHEQARAAPRVTDVQLSAQEYFEQAWARGDDDLDGKIADYSDAIRVDAEYAVAFNNRGAVRADQGDLEGAIADYDEAIRLDPVDAVAFRNRGRARAIQGDLEGAMVDYDQAVRLDPGLAAAFYDRGAARADQGDLEGAIADYDEAIRLDPADALAFNNRGLVRAGYGALTAAIADYDEAIRLDPNLAVAFNNRALARGVRGDLEEAIADFDEALRLDPTYAMAFYNRGLTRRDQGDLEGAIADLEQGAALAPEAEIFPQQLAELRLEI